VNNSRGSPTVYNDPSTVGPVAGVGIESQDIISMVDRMMRDMLANPTLAGKTPAPRVVIDAMYFKNESSSIINKNVITDLLRTELNRAANGRMVFLGRHYADMTENEREAENAGVVTGGTQGATKEALGYDYRLGGRITSIDAVDSKTSFVTRYNQIIFEMVERGSGTIVWSGTYQFKKSAQDDIVYR
jgi:PBP1b-binding outer membrane lipoprotein LpoB